jgi:hypothetical protein
LDVRIPLCANAAHLLHLQQTYLTCVAKPFSMIAAAVDVLDAIVAGANIVTVRPGKPRCKKHQDFDGRQIY